MSSRIRFSTARQVFDAYQALGEDVDAEANDDDPIVFVQALIEESRSLEAATFCAYLLPKREAIWWTLTAVRHFQKEHSASGMRLLSLSEEWVRDPSSDLRAEIARDAEAAKRTEAATWIGYAVAWTGGSMSPIEDQHVAPPKELTAKACRAALIIAIAGLEPASQEASRQQLVQAAINFARGGELTFAN